MFHSFVIVFIFICLYHWRVATNSAYKFKNEQMKIFLVKHSYIFVCTRVTITSRKCVSS